MDKIDIVLIATVIGCILTGVWIYKENYEPSPIYQCSESNPTYPKSVRDLCKRLGK
jgi:hypothetical protein